MREGIVERHRDARPVMRSVDIVGENRFAMSDKTLHLLEKAAELDALHGMIREDHATIGRTPKPSKPGPPSICIAKQRKREPKRAHRHAGSVDDHGTIEATRLKSSPAR